MYPVETNPETTWLVTCYLRNYDHSFCRHSCHLDRLGVRSCIVTVVASIALATGICPAATAGNLDVRPTYALIPIQLSMDRKTPPNAPVPKKSMSARTRPDDGLTPGEQRRLAEAINRMTPKERKRLAKAMKHLTPEGRRQLTDVVKRQLAGDALSQATKHGR